MKEITVIYLDFDDGGIPRVVVGHFYTWKMKCGYRVSVRTDTGIPVVLENVRQQSTDNNVYFATGVHRVDGSPVSKMRVKNTQLESPRQIYTATRNYMSRHQGVSLDKVREHIRFELRKGVRHVAAEPLIVAAYYNLPFAEALKIFGYNLPDGSLSGIVFIPRISENEPEPEPEPEKEESPAWFFDVLGIEGFPESKQDAVDAVKHAFREKARVLHPDVGGSTEGFRELQAAREAAITQINAVFPVGLVFSV